MTWGIMLTAHLTAFLGVVLADLLPVLSKAERSSACSSWRLYRRLWPCSA